MRGYGTFHLPKGSWTDDSSLTIALLESIRRTGKIDLEDIMGNFMKWLYDGEFTPYGESYDIGRGTMQAIDRYRKNRKVKKFFFDYVSFSRMSPASPAIQMHCLSICFGQRASL